MKKSLCSIALSGALVIAGSAFAQTATTAQQDAAPAPAMQPHHGMSPDQQVAHLTKALELSPDQANQIKPILTDRQQQMEALHQDQSMSQQDKMAKMKTLHDDSNAKIEAVLNDTQKQKFAQMQAKQQERRQSQQNGAPPSN